MTVEQEKPESAKIEETLMARVAEQGKESAAPEVQPERAPVPPAAAEAGKPQSPIPVEKKDDAAGQPGEEDREEKELGEDLKQTPDEVAARIRARYKKRLDREREERRQLQERLTAAEARAAEAQRPRGEPERPAAPQADPGKVFSILARAESVLGGDADAEIESIEKAGDLKKMAEDCLAEMEPADLLDVVEAARSGKFGKHGERIAERAAQALAVAQAKTSERTTQAQQAAGLRQQQLHQAYERHPDLRPPAQGTADSPMRKFVTQYIGEKVGTREKPGPWYAWSNSRPEAAGEVIDAAVMAYNASRYDSVATERDNFKRQLESVRSPEGGGRGPGDAAPGAMKESDRLRDELQSRVGRKLS